MAQTVTLSFRDGTEEVYDGASINVMGDFLIVERSLNEEQTQGKAEFIPSGSLRRASLDVDFSEEIAEIFEEAEESATDADAEAV